MSKFVSTLSSLEPRAHALLRIVAGFMFSIHGFQKIFGWLTDRPAVALASQMGLGGLIELVGGLLVMLGLWTRQAAFLASGTMAVAYIQFHWKFEFGEKFFPAVNRGELAALYCFVFLWLACKGSGPWALRKD